MPKITLLIFLLTINVHANSAKDALKSLEKAQEYVQKMETTVADPMCENCSNSELLKRCLQETCAKGKISENYLQLDEQQKAKVLQNLNDPKIKAAYEQYKAALKKFGDTEIDIFEKNILYSNSILQSGQLSNDTDKLSWLTLLHLTNLRSKDEIAKLPPSLLATHFGATQEFKKQVEKNYNFLADSPQIYIESEYKGLDLKKAIDIEFRKYEQAREALLKTTVVRSLPSFGDYADSFYNSKTYRDYKAGKDISIDDLGPLLTSRTMLELLSNFVETSSVLNLHKTLDVQAAKGLMLSDTIKPKVGQLAAQIKDYQKSQEYNEYIENCATEFVATYANLPDKDVHQKLDEISKDLKAKVKQKVLNKLSEQTSSRLSKIIDNVSFHAMDKDSFLSQSKALLDFEQSRQHLSSTVRMSEAERKARASVNLEMLSYQPEGVENRRFILQNVLSETHNLCNSNRPSIISDATYSRQGVITVSRGSAMNWDAGRAIMAHELGHIIDRSLTPDMSEASYLAKSYINKCLSENHKNPHIPAYQFVSEDYSDMISAVLEGPTGNNVGCFLNAEDTAESKDDPHSSSFFRLLHVEKTMRGSVPSTCERYVKTRFTLDNPSSCWK